MDCPVLPLLKTRCKPIEWDPQMFLLFNMSADMNTTKTLSKRIFLAGGCSFLKSFKNDWKKRSQKKIFFLYFLQTFLHSEFSFSHVLFLWHWKYVCSSAGGGGEFYLHIFSLCVCSSSNSFDTDFYLEMCLDLRYPFRDLMVKEFSVTKWKKKSSLLPCWWCLTRFDIWFFFPREWKTMEDFHCI